MDLLLEKLKDACEVICFDYEDEFKHCESITYEDRI